MPGPTDTQDAPDTATLTEEVLGEVRDVLADVIGEDYVSELDIESNEFVAMGEVLRERYGDRIDFVEWLTTMELDDIIALTVGELVDHIVEKLGR